MSRSTGYSAINDVERWIDNEFNMYNNINDVQGSGEQQQPADGYLDSKATTGEQVIAAVEMQTEARSKTRRGNIRVTHENERGQQNTGEVNHEEPKGNTNSLETQPEEMHLT